MRIESENGIVTMMRGDSLVMPIYINTGTKLDPVYEELTGSDCLYFGLMEPGQAFEDAVLKKKYDSLSKKDENGNTLLILEPKDTEKLLVGKYYYMIKLKKIDESENVSVTTLVTPTQFFLGGNNVNTEDIPYYMTDRYVKGNLIIDGGDTDTETTEDEIIWDGGIIE